MPHKNHPGTEYLYKSGFPRGKVSFTPVPFETETIREDKEFPFVLSTGRNLFQYHYGSMTRRVKALESHAGSAYVELHPDDAGRLKIGKNDSVKISSKAGSIIVPVRITDRVRQEKSSSRSITPRLPQIFSLMKRPLIIQKLRDTNLHG